GADQPLRPAFAGPRRLRGDRRLCLGAGRQPPGLEFRRGRFAGRGRGRADRRRAGLGDPAPARRVLRAGDLRVRRAGAAGPARRRGLERRRQRYRRHPGRLAAGLCLRHAGPLLRPGAGGRAAVERRPVVAVPASAGPCHRRRARQRRAGRVHRPERASAAGAVLRGRLHAGRAGRRAAGALYRLCLAGVVQHRYIGGVRHHAGHRRAPVRRGAAGRSAGVDAAAGAVPRRRADPACVLWRGADSDPALPAGRAGRPGAPPVQEFLMSDALLQVDGLSRRFGGLAALRGLSFTVAEGEIFGLIGPNGAGKTTAFNVISGSMPPSAGRVRFAGRDIAGAPPSRAVAAGLARTFQSTSTYPAVSVAENVYRGMLSRLAGSAAARLAGRRDATLARRQVAAEGDGILRLTGLLAWPHAPAGALAYGLQKKLGIAVALAARPRMLLLDEPAAGLNHEECRELGRLLRRLRDDQGLTLLLVEHHMALVMELCQRIVVLVQGEKIAEGTPRQIREHPAVIEAYLGAPDYAHA